ncbi:MAG: putative sugar nucleotidyl transferase [Candidatus Zixiibacteriota bacterium]
MALRICVYEDTKFTQFNPLTLTRPVYTLRAGIMPLFRRAGRMFVDSELCLVSREQVAALLAEQFKDYPVNIIKREKGSDVLFLNGRVRSFGDLPNLVKEARLSTVFKHDGETVAILFKPESMSTVSALATPEIYMAAYQNEASEFPDLSTSATLYNYLWEIVADVESEIVADFGRMKTTAPPGENIRVYQGAYLVNNENILMGNDVEIAPLALVDASKGPVYIGANVRVEAHAAIYGPCFIGANSVVLAGKIKASSIGHTCRVGGEVEESVFHAYVNKYHAGFIGHSYVGPWVNFGAMTTNSDLKNNYSTIRSTVNGESLNTGSQKVGSFIGDHTKFGIGTLLNTGINIGACCNIFGGGLTSDKEIASFSWGNTGSYRKFALDKALETVRVVAERRNTSLSGREADLLKAIHEGRVDRTGVIDL